jgi:RNA polymerase sigma-70 factor (ECF subfamily)
VLLQAILCAPRDVAGLSRDPDGTNPLRVRDDEWIVQIQQGDEVAFERLFCAYVTSLVNFAASYVGDTDVARELVSDVFLNVWERRTEWAPANGAAAYLFGAVRNRAFNYERGRRRQERRIEALAREEEHAVPPLDVTAEQLEELSPQEIAATIDRMLAELPKQRRQIMILHWRHEMSADEIAEVMGMTRNAVYVSLHRSLKTLRQLFGPALA